MLGKKFVKFILHNRITVIILMIAVIVAGIYSYYVIPKRENPDTTVAAAVVTTIYPGATPSEVEENVTNVLEDKIKTLKNIDYYSSSSMNSVSVLLVMYDLDVQVSEVESDLRQAISDTQALLPDLAQESMVNTDVVDENQFIISLSGEEYSDSDLVEFAESAKEIIEEVEGIESVVIEGASPKRVVVETDSEKMQNYSINIENIIQLMQAQNLSIPSGSIQYDDTSINVVTPAVFESLADIENTVISGAEDSLSFVRLKDVADVYISEEQDYYFAQDSNRAILLTGTITPEINAVIVGEELRKAIDSAKAQLPDDLIFHEVMYAPEDIDNSINSFVLNLGESILLIVIVVMIGVHLRNGIIVSVALPLSILITFIVMNLIGVDFHFISIAALIVSLGILVDNAIVISEAIQQNLNSGIAKTKAITQGVRETAIPVLTSTLTTIATFSIIYFVPGTVGQIAGEIPTVVITALIASYIVAMCAVPVLAYYFFKPEHNHKEKKMSFIKRFFDFMLIIALKHKIMTVCVSFMTLGVAALLAMQLGLQFFPVANKPIIYINYESENMSIESTEDISLQINEILDSDPVVDNYTYGVGNGLPNFFLTVPSVSASPNVGQYMLQLNKEELLTSGGVEEKARDLQEVFDKSIAGATVTVRCLEYSLPTEATITLSVSGEDIEKISAVADEIVILLNEIDGTAYVRNTNIMPQYDYNINMDSELLSTYGLLKYDVLKQINSSLMGVNVGTYYAGNSNLDILVKSDITSLSELENLQIYSSIAPTSVNLEQIAQIDITPSVPLIKHYNSDKYVNVLSDVLPGYNSVNIENELFNEKLESLDLDGIEITSNGEASNMFDLILSLGISSVIAVFIIYLILYFQFKNFTNPLIVLSSIPLSFIGCGFGLWIFRMDIQAMALLGLVSLFGIVVNNSILLIEAINSEIANGKDMNEACISAVNQRFRPIMLSSTTTCIGLIPLILSGDAMTAPMASVLLFGLLFSTILTMVVVPTIFSIKKRK